MPQPNASLIVWYPLNDGTGRFGRRIAGYGTGPGNAFIQSCTDDTHMTLAGNPWYSSEASCPTGQSSSMLAAVFTVWDIDGAGGQRVDLCLGSGRLL